MPALSKLIGRKDKQQQKQHHQLQLKDPSASSATSFLQLNQDESSSITNSIIFTRIEKMKGESTSTSTCSSISENEVDDHTRPINSKMIVPLVISSTSSSDSNSIPSSCFKRTMDPSHSSHNNNKSPSPMTTETVDNYQPHLNNTNYYKNLTHLDISGNSAEKLDLRSLTRLEWLCCSHNNLEILVLSGISLTYLDCSHNNLQCISVDPIPNNLSTLQVSFNHLEDLPVWTWIIPELYTIYASNNHLRQIDCKYQNCLSQLPIRELYCYSNKIEFISKDFIQRATRLKVFNLSQNLIEFMPNFGKRSPIQELYLSRNQLQDNENRNALDFLLDCTNIRRLYLAFNKIQHINERCLMSWKNLEELILCGNRIRSLPSKLSSLPNLRVLRVHFNQLETVPNLTKISGLKVVDLSHNNLKKINLEDLIIGGNLTYLDISCNEKLSLNLENFQSPKRPMNLVEVTHPRKILMDSSSTNEFLHLNNKNSCYDNNVFPFSINPPWDLGFSELPDRNQVLSVVQYRDINLSNGKEALFGLFDSGDGNPAPKSLSKSIAKIYVEEKVVDGTPKFSVKYTLLNALNSMFDADRNLRQQGNTKPMQGVLCLLSMYEHPNNVENPTDQLLQPTGNRTLTLNLAMIGNVRCILIESGKKIKVLTEPNPNYDPATTTTTTKSTTDSQENKSNTDASHNNTNGSPNKIIQDPLVVSVTLTRAAEFLVIANQNVWNYIDDKELLDELDLHRHKKSVLISKRITDMAQSHSCKDSLSLILVRFKWNSNNPSSNTGSSKNNILLDTTKSHVSLIGENGPMSYVSPRNGSVGDGSSDGGCYSDEQTNALASVTTPDSAIDTDNHSSRSESISDSNKSSNSNSAKDRDLRTITAHPSTKISNDDVISLSNTSQMSVEQFRCWEYMLEQNTRLLFKKELDSLSKATFQRQQKQRKSVHFPFKQQVQQQPNDKSSPILFQAHQEDLVKQDSKSKATGAGFFTLSKAKSLSQLFGVDQRSTSSNPKGKASHGNLSVAFRPKESTSHYHLAPQMFTVSHVGGPHYLQQGIRAARGKIIGGPNAAYFGSAQRLIPTSEFFPTAAALEIPVTTHHPHQKQNIFRERDEIQEMQNFDSIEPDNRLKNYWDNKITEL